MKLSDKFRTLIGQFIRFGLVGVANTAVYYLFYRIFLLFVPYLGAHVLGWALATLFSFYVNAYFTFRERPTLRRLAAFPLSSLVNLVISTVVSAILVSGVGASENWGTVVGGIVAIPFTFAVVRLVFTSKALTQASRHSGTDEDSPSN